jgi:hypothetical protein
VETHEDTPPSSASGAVAPAQQSSAVKISLHNFLVAARLTKFQAALGKLGAETVEDLREVEEEDLDLMQMAKLEKRRFYKHLGSCRE